MIKEFVLKWEERKEALENKIRSTEQSNYDTYEKLVKMLFDVVINYGKPSYEQYDTNYINTIDNGDYRGVYIFILHKDTYYSPEVEDYVYTSVCYGSCSGCDTLKNINGDNYSDGLPENWQINDYMTLLMHMLQKCHRFES